MKFFLGKRDKIASFRTMLMSKGLVFGEAVLFVSLNGWCEMPLCLHYHRLSSPIFLDCITPKRNHNSLSKDRESLTQRHSGTSQKKR